MNNILNYKKIEGILYSYNTIKCEIINLKLDIEDLKDDVGISSNKFDAVDSGRCDCKGNISKVETIAFSRGIKIERIEREIRTKERLIQKVDNALELLNKEDKLFIELRYFNKIPMNNLAERCCVEPITMYKRKDNIIKQLTTVL